LVINAVIIVLGIGLLYPILWLITAFFKQSNTKIVMAEQGMPWDVRFLTMGWSPALGGKLATQQGYEGTRWPKMTDISGIDSPSTIGGYLCWQQPHLIYFTESLYRKRPSQETLDRYAELVFASGTLPRQTVEPQLMSNSFDAVIEH
jgi:hypothetical protein